MTAATYLYCFLAGLAGMLFQVFAIKIPQTQKRAQVANVPFSYSNYLKDDSAAILASLMAILILLLVLEELVSFKPGVLPWLNAMFVFVGYTGQSILLTILGRAQAKIDSIVNVKTDISDGITNNVPIVGVIADTTKPDAV